MVASTCSSETLQNHVGRALNYLIQLDNLKKDAETTPVNTCLGRITGHCTAVSTPDPVSYCDALAVNYTSLCPSSASTLFTIL